MWNVCYYSSYFLGIIIIFTITIIRLNYLGNELIYSKIE